MIIKNVFSSLVASFDSGVCFSKLIQHTSLASLVWNVAIMQIFLYDITMRDMMIHPSQNITTSKSYRNALCCVLFPQCVVLSIIFLKTSSVNWCTVMNIYILTKKNWNPLLIGSLQRQLLVVSRCVYIPLNS